MANQEKPKLNASQRLETLEVNMQEVSMYLNNMARDLQLIKEAIKLLGNKTDAVQKSAGVSDEQVSMLMMQNNVVELQGKLQNFVDQGVLVASDLITEQSFIVGREIDDNGKVVNPRVQFAAGSINEDLRAKLLNAKVGDQIQFSEGTLKFEVSEVYAIVPPPVEEAPAPEVAPEA